MNILLSQTCDGDRYKGFLDATENHHRAYAARHGYSYQRYDGICSGSFPWHAAFNRIYLIQRAIEEASFEWMLHLDADAVVIDPDRSIDEFLHPEAMIVACRGASDDENIHWDINNGVMLVNLRHQGIAGLVSRWRNMFERSLKLDAFNRDTDWDQYDEEHSDQWMLQRLLKELCSSSVVVYRGKQHNAFNYGGPFIQQMLRSKSLGLQERIDWVKQVLRDVSDENTNVTRF